MDRTKRHRQQLVGSADARAPDQMWSRAAPTAACATTGQCDVTLVGIGSRPIASLIIPLASQPTPAIDVAADSGGHRRRGRSRLLSVLAALATLGVTVVATIVVLHARHHVSSANEGTSFTPPPVTWGAGSHMAPNFQLVDQRGAPISLSSFRGRTTIVTFLDPLCRNVCPLEARVLADAIRGLPQAIRPAIIAVSVNPRGDTRANFRSDASHWRLTANWRWAIGSPTQLAAVWRTYEIEARVVTKHRAGATVHEVEHGDAAFIVDRSGYRRAMFLFPFTAPDVAHEIRTIDSSP